jgi:ribosomal protein S18 acetylase RimI-like enzyme
VRDYAADKVRAGTWSPAEAQSNEGRGRLLPEGPATRDHLLYVVRADTVPTSVGTVWFALGDLGVGRSVWIYEIIIHENFRRYSYASRTLDLVEHKAAQLGATNVGLHVSGHNQGAQALYKNKGYTITSITMAKPIQSDYR